MDQHRPGIITYSFYIKALNVTALYCDFTQRRVVIGTDVSGQPIVPILKGHEFFVVLDFLVLEMELLCCPYTSAQYYHCTLRNIPE